MLRYFLFYKPYQVLSQFSPEGTKTTLAHFFTDIPKDIYPVGRLDFDSEGLLLLTNDKQLTHRLLEPRFAHPRTYYAQVEGSITTTAIQQLQNGVDININGKIYRTQQSVASLIDPMPSLPERNPPIRYRKDIPTSWLSLTLHEGKNRQVRKMTAATGFPTLRLVRFSIGSVTIGDLQPGTWIEADPGIPQRLMSR